MIQRYKGIFAAICATTQGMEEANAEKKGEKNYAKGRAKIIFRSIYSNGLFAGTSADARCGNRA
ncbi:hypothetical protein MPNT_80060 [Candidatus Methylacidithermus pantelleriae]|uniref:Uncharacterized protein n=1 Tax=Candidatus Methylacidithermus pantelleriae TaxID=2744239 RepID=A0A8J2BSV6_9BACT|nr:hypothetical protein MPNT_80060 [Candidatus Methylacidithermus pantelleriae]